MKQSVSNKLTRNVFSIAVGQGVSLIVNFFAIALVARYLGVAEFGDFGFYLAVISILSKVIDLGFGAIVFREISLSREKYTLLSTALSIRLILFIIVFLVYNLIFIINKSNNTTIIVSDILFLNIIISSKFGNFRELMDVPFKAELSMSLPMKVVMVENVILLAGVVIMPLINGGLYYFVSIYSLSNLPGFLAILFILYKKFGYIFKFQITRYNWLIKESLPLWSFVLLNILFQQIDIIFLNGLHDNYATGIYSAASRLSIPLIIIPTAIIHTIFPILLNSDKERNEIILKFITKTIFLIPFLIAAVFMFKGTLITSIVFGSQYAKAGNSASLLLWSQVFLFNSFLIVNLLVVYKKQFWIMIYSVIILFFNVMLDIVLIPKYSYDGASGSKLIASVIGTIFTYWVYKKINLSINLEKIRLLIWCVFILICIYACSLLSLIPYLIISAAIIVSTIILIGIYSRSELLFFLRIINKEPWIKFIKTN